MDNFDYMLKNPNGKKIDKYGKTTEGDMIRQTGNVESAKPTAKANRGRGDPTKMMCYLKELSKYHDNGDPIFENINLSFFKGAKIGVLGINGSGKSTLMRVIAQEDDEYDGDIDFPGKPKIGYLHQEPELDISKNVRENVLDGVKDQMQILNRYRELSDAGKVKSKEYKDLEKKVKKDKLLQLESNSERALTALRCPDPDREVDNLSGGEKRRVALCRLLLQQPDFLLLDEPTNHLDAESVAWLERYLSEYKGTVIAITHDRYFLDNVAGWILEIDRGVCYPYEGNYTEWLIAKQKRLVTESKKTNVLSKFLEREKEWIHRGPNGRNAKNKLRVENYYEKLASYKNQTRYTHGTISIPPGPKLGTTVINVKNLSIKMNNKTLFENINFSIPPGSIVGIVGPNGVGKSTLFRIITGDLEPETGSVEVGNTVKLGYVSQSRLSLDDNNSVYEEIADGTDAIEFGNFEMNVRQYISLFNFKGAAQEKKVGQISGGERNRVHLAKMLKSGANVLMLDEPTNDVDVDVLRNMEESLSNYPGCAIIVSHDRWFLDRLATHILGFEDDNVVFHEGNYSSYAEDKVKRLGKGANKFRYIRLTNKGQ
eukprot:TRINITY_DN1147_c0_g1_i2.p1 TRINITY_DN1147_c0_g1~~TRINITY_DN1147_c0_g1_i2.p1  ORF type:complete len:598 (-),score=141.57 TRINITY_DN1147_c0_g1_i2:2132-3925(-)